MPDVSPLGVRLNKTSSSPALGLDGDAVSTSNFPLPNLSRVLKDYTRSLHNDIGFFVGHGMELSRYSIEDGVVIYLGIASYIGDKRGVQDGKGNVLSREKTPKPLPLPFLAARLGSLR